MVFSGFSCPLVVFRGFSGFHSAFEKSSLGFPQQLTVFDGLSCGGRSGLFSLGFLNNNNT